MLTPNVMVLGHGAFGKVGLEGGDLVNGFSVFIRDTGALLPSV